MKTKADLQRLTEALREILERVHDIDTAGCPVLAALARAFAVQWATYWKVDVDARKLHALATWTENPRRLERLLRDTKTRTLALSEGAPGHVWRSGRPLCTSDLIRDMCLPRSLNAQEAGCTTGIWFPVQANETTLGVIELLGKDSWPDTQQFLDQLVTIGNFIGMMLRECRGN
jgi:hypothetical protein